MALSTTCGPDDMEPSQIKQQIADLTERADALRGYL
jgi:hypothetical protein